MGSGLPKHLERVPIFHCACAARGLHGWDVDDEEGTASETPFRDSVIIFDWDDTLMCSTDIKAQRDPSAHELRKLELSVRAILLSALRLGRTAIVTNANLGWVEASANVFMPGLLPILDKVQVLSARQSYEELFPDDFTRWKKEAFRDILISSPCQSRQSAQRNGLTMPPRLDGIDKCVDTKCDAGDLEDTCSAYDNRQKYAVAPPSTGDTQCVVLAGLTDCGDDFGWLPTCSQQALQPPWTFSCLNLVVLGDSTAEIQAGRSTVDAAAPNSLVKTIKFKAFPSLEDLVEQLDVVALNLQFIVEEQRNVHKKLVQGSCSVWRLSDVDV